VGGCCTVEREGSPNNELAIGRHIWTDDKDKTANGEAGTLQDNITKKVTIYFLRYMRWCNLI
jgi:hypothetical protein